MEHRFSSKEMELNGKWYVAYDRAQIGKNDGWQNKMCASAVPAIFPGFIQDTISDFRGGVAWYYTEFDLKDMPAEQDSFLRLCFYEYIVELWLNGTYLGRAEGRMLIDEFECTKAIREGKNFLAIRVVVPGEEELEGYTWRDLPMLHSPESTPCGGIWDPVRLSFRPRLRTEKPRLIADYATGNVTLDYVIRNRTDVKQTVEVSYTVVSDNKEEVAAYSEQIVCPEGDTAAHALLHVEDFIPWDTENPFLYTITVGLVGETQRYTYQLDFGFRDFRVKDGWFHLNGKRILVKGGFLTEGFHYWGAPSNSALLRKELFAIKNMGVNFLRYHNGVAKEELLDLCDRIGMLVVEGHAASWNMKESAKTMEEVYDHHLLHTMEQGINHTAIVAWELINESHHKRERDHAVEVLQTLRDLDMTRVVFVGSGRWDHDMRVGSISNPGSRSWECVWGEESPDAPLPTGPEKKPYSARDLGSWTLKEDDTKVWDPRLGDVHIYTRIPMTWRAKYILKNHGKYGNKPVYISEFGTSSLGNAIKMTRHFERLPYEPKNSRIMACAISADFLEKEFEHYKLGDEYPFPDDLVLVSHKEDAYQWASMLDHIRANPKCAGYTFTCGGGNFSAMQCLDLFKDHIPFKTEAVTECLKPLHWCLLLNKEHVYENQPFTVEAVLSMDDGQMQPGSYPVTARIAAPELGCVWEHTTTLTIPEPVEGEYAPICYSVFKEEVRIPKAGRYNCVVNLDRGGAPSGGRQEIIVDADDAFVHTEARLIGFEDGEKAWLMSHGVKENDNADLIVVGSEKMEDAEFDALMEKVRAGAKMVILKPEVLYKGVEDPYQWWVRNVPERLPVEKKGILLFSDNWAYRVHTVLKKSKYSEGLPAGLLEDKYWDQIEPLFVFEDVEDPDFIASATIGAPYFDGYADETNGNLTGITLGEYNYGKGCLVVNCYRILDELGNNPAAGRLLVNILK